VKHLLKHIHQMKNADPTAKCVIFSQWTSFLDILRVPRPTPTHQTFWLTTHDTRHDTTRHTRHDTRMQQPLEEDGIGFVGLDGRMNHQKRKEVMHQFNNDPSVTALLISLKAGGVVRCSTATAHAPHTPHPHAPRVRTRRAFSHPVGGLLS
jgi:hypothetical protein